MALLGVSSVGLREGVWRAVWCVCVSRSVVSNSLQPHGLYPARLLCPCNSLGKNTGVGSHSLLQGIFPLGIEPKSSALQANSLLSEPPGRPGGQFSFRLTGPSNPQPPSFSTWQPRGTFTSRNLMTWLPYLKSPFPMASHCPSNKTEP